ncbi:cytochrome P450 6AB4 [Danaus plexippus plexippus]|uniref:unspecific monooxygenase n=1 Tax=Danaus plexippus plexippus TaxID=278856 RepID=A0A212F7D4_DANPL|nr:cytochrome P450 6AB4 [Danaus plexippus plexippus]
MFFESFVLNLSFLAVLVVALTFDYVTKYFNYWYIRHIPNKTPIPFFGTDYHRVLGLRNTSEEVSTLYKKYEKEKYIGCIKSRIPDLIVKDPESVKKILSTDFSNFHCRGYGLDRSQDVCLRNNLFYAEGEKWTLLRRKFELLLNNMNNNIQDSLHDCLSGTNGDTNVQQLLSDILDTVFKDMLIDNNNDGSAIKYMRKIIQKRTLSDKIKSYLKCIFPSIYNVLGFLVIPRQSLKQFVNVIKESRIMKVMKKTELIVQDEMMNDVKKYDTDSEFETAFSIIAHFISEGYVPCQYLLTVLLFELAKNPDIQSKARDSIKILANKDEENNYFKNTIREALRLHPPYSVITRKCMKLYQFNKDIVIDKGVTITIPVEALHNDDKNYKDANIFNPSRFSDVNEKNYTFIPFGAGPRKCIGEQLALEIVGSITSTILEKFYLETCDKTPIVLPVTDFNSARCIERDIWLKFKPIKDLK